MSTSNQSTPPSPDRAAPTPVVALGGGAKAARRTLSPRLAYALVAAVIGLALFASSTPSPLYAEYRALWGFSSVVLTLVYATYAFGVLLALLLAGRVSDEWGRRPVLVVALGALLLTSLLFMVADSVTWLFVARPSGPRDRARARRGQRRVARPASPA